MVERVITSLDDGITPFNELSVAEFYPLIELDSANKLTALRDKQTTTNSGSITEVEGQFKLSTGTTASSTAQLDTKEKGRYQPGIEALGGIAVRRPVAPTGNQFWEAGYFDDNNGHWIGEDATGIYVRMRVGGTDRDKVRPSGWMAKADLSINLKRMTIFRFPFLAYYGGPLQVKAVVVSDNGIPSIETLHSFGPVDDEPIVEQSKLPIRAQVSNGGDEKDLSLFVGGRHFAVLGRYEPNRRKTSERRFSVSIGTTIVPLISFKRRDIASELAKSVKISGVGTVSDADALLEVHLDATSLSGSDFNAISDIATSESAMFSDISASSMSAGQVIERWLVPSGQGNSTNMSGIRNLGLDSPDDATVTLAARAISGSGTLSSVFSLEEEW